MAGVGTGKKQIRGVNGVGGAENTHEKLEDSVLIVMNVLKLNYLFWQHQLWE